MTQTINETDTAIVFNEAAMGVVQDCTRQVEAIARAWTGDPSVARKANETLLRSLTSALSFGGRITRDGDLSLYVSSYMQLGMIFFPMHRRVAPPLPSDHIMHRAPYMGRYCMKMLDDNTRYCASPVYDTGVRGGRPSCKCADPNTIVAMPVPGEWSLHS